MNSIGCGAVALAAVALLAGEVSADVYVYADIYKDKDVFVFEDIDINKEFDVNVDLTAEYAGAAEAQALVNVINAFNVADKASLDKAPAFERPSGQAPPPGQVAGDPLPFRKQLRTQLVDSILDNTGIVGVNQDAGVNTNQGNVVSFALTDSEFSFTNSQAEVDQINFANFLVDFEDIEEALVAAGAGTFSEFLDVFGQLENSHRLAFTANSINNNSGIVGVNQNVGSNNNQHNTVAAAVGRGAKVALSEAALGQLSAFNQIYAAETIKRDHLNNSANFNSGMVDVNQTVGANNNQASTTSFAVLTSEVRVSVPGTPGGGS